MRLDSFVNPREIVAYGRADVAPAVSIIMPTFRRNHEGLLTRAIESALGQTFRDFEYIIVDDGSTDGTEAVCRQFAAQDPRIVYIRYEENSGLPAVRVNPAIMAARAQYVTFIFDDNVWVSDFLETLVRHSKATSADVVYANMVAMLPNAKQHLAGNWPLSVELLMHMNLIPAGGVFCRKDFFDRFGLFDPHLILRRINDWDMWLRALRLGATFSHCDKMIAREYGPTSPASLENSVQMDYKTACAYVLCEKQLESRAAALRPDAIASYDVFDPERIMPYLRDFEEWETTKKMVYEPFFRTHPNYVYHEPLRHNRRSDAELTGYGCNNPRGIFRDRMRVLLVSNRCDRLVEEWIRALTSQLKAVVLSCSESNISYFRPCDIDLLVLLDCSALHLLKAIQAFTANGVPITYCTVHGMDPCRASAPDPLCHLDLAQHPQLINELRPSTYYPLPGLPWNQGQRAIAMQLMAKANQVLSIGDGQNVPIGTNHVTHVGFVPNGISGGPPTAKRSISPTLYLGDGSTMAVEMIEAVGRLLERTPTGNVWTIFVSPGTSEPAPWGKYRNQYCLIGTNEPLLRLAARLEDTYLVVPESILERHSAFHRSLMEEDLACNGSALAGIQETVLGMPREPSKTWFRERIQIFWARCKNRGTAARSDARDLHWTNLALSSLFLGRRAKTLPGKRFDPRKIYVFINSQLVGDSETMGIFLSKALTSLGFDARTCIPKHSICADKDDFDLHRWLRAHNLPHALKAAYGMGKQCHKQSKKKTLQSGIRLANWLDKQGVSTTIGSGFISELVLGPPSDRLIFMGLTQPGGQPLDEMTFLRDCANGLFSDSRWSTQEWARWMAPPVQWVPSIVDPHHFKPPRPHVMGPVRIAIGGTLRASKRQLESLQAVKALVQDGHDLHVNVYGYELTMMNDYIREVKSLADDPALRDRVIFHGLVDMATISCQNDILLTASLDDSMPQTLLIGMAGGLVPVACPCGGVSEVVKPGTTGFLAEGFSVDDIKKALKQCLEKRKEWPEFVARSQALLVEDYSEPIVANRFLKFMLDGEAIATSRGQNCLRAASDQQGNCDFTVANNDCQLVWCESEPPEAFGRQLWNGPAIGRHGIRYPLRCENGHLSGLQWCVSASAISPCDTLRLSIISRSSGVIVRQVDVDLSDSAGLKWVKVQFPPIVNSAGCDFTVLATAEVAKGRCVFFESWPQDVPRYRQMASRAHKRLGKWLGIPLSRSFSPFFPLYEPKR